MRTISSDEYKELVAGCNVVHNTTAVKVLLKTKRMSGFETSEGFKYKAELVHNYTLEKQ